MNRIDRALLCAFCVIAFSTIHSMGLPRVESPRYRRANNAQYQPQQANMQQWNQPGQTAHIPQASWSAGQLHRYGGYNSSGSMSNPWPRGYNNAQSYQPTQPGSYNPNLPGWRPQQQNPYQSNTATTTNWQNPNQNPTQSHLYPQLPNSNQNWNGGRQQPPILTPAMTTTTTTPMPMHRWNNTILLPGGNQQQNWANGQNAWGNAVTIPPTTTTTTTPNYGKVPQNYPNGYNLPNQADASNYWNRPNSAYGNSSNNNNFGLGGSASPNQNTWNSGGNNPTAQNGWQRNPTSNTPTNNNGGWQNSAQNNWQGGSTGTGGNNPNWYNSPNMPQGNSGVPLAGGSVQVGGISSSGVPLAPIGGVINPPNSWNTAGSNGSPQLAPLAPSTYGSGNDPNDLSKKGNTNPYSNLFH